MKILYITDLSDRKANGVSVAVSQLLNSICHFADVTWLNLNDSKFDIDDKVKRVTLNDYINNHPDIAVFEDPFNTVRYCRIASRLKKEGIPYVLSPHGCFHKTALKRRWLKKIIAINTILRPYLKGCVATQYLTENEKNNSYGENESLIIPNGIIDKGHYRIRKKAQKLFFIGRKAKYNKGLDLLLEACRDIKIELREHSVQINIYGSIESETDELYINRTIVEYGLEGIVSNYGPIFGEEKDKVLYEGDVFIQMSRHEGFPMSILEAFTYGCPVGITEGTNVGPIVNDKSAGWVCSSSTAAIKKMLIDIISSSPKEISQKSKNARQLTDLFSWQKVCQKTIEEYEKLVGRE